VYFIQLKPAIALCCQTGVNLLFFVGCILEKSLIFPRLTEE
jgi:hypothetical protein